ANPPNSDEVVVTVCAVLTDDCELIGPFLEQTSRILSERFRYYELLLIDNAFNRSAGLCIREWQKRMGNIRLLRLSRRYSYEIALAAALDSSIGDYVVVMNLATDPPGMIPDLVTTAMSGYDVVIAERASQGEPLLRKWLSRAFYRIATITLGYQLLPNA